MTDLHDDAGIRDAAVRSDRTRHTVAARPQHRGARSGDAVAPLVFAAGVVRAAIAFGAALVAVVVSQAGRPDPIDIEPRILQRHQRS